METGSVRGYVLFMRIKHHKRRKMYCDDSLSRRRSAEEDDKEQFFVEPGQLFKLHVPTQCGEEDSSLLQYLQAQTNQDLSDSPDDQVLPSTTGA